ncbi:hypothetical protein CF327_g5064 [Tilletia walkeri]|nr:hypothetical protein CF327_g5064 [Tilletia walkeri]
MQFKIGEKVLCFHGPLLYTAKILKAENRTADEGAQIEAAATQEGYVVTTSQAGPFYFVHYQGWKTTWDEWVPETRLMKFIDENLQFAKQLAQSFRGASNKASVSTSISSSALRGGKAGSAEDDMSVGEDGGPPGTGGGGSGSGAAGGSGSGPTAGRTSGGAKNQGSGATGRGAKRTREIAEQEDEYVKRPEVKIPIPEPLKIILVDDWERVTKNSQLVQLPRKPCVQQVLEDYKAHYIKHRKGAKRTNATTLAEVLDGLRLYFDKSLTHNLLYRFERLQYTEFRKAWMQGLERDGFNVTGQEFIAGVRSRTEEEVEREKEKGKGKQGGNAPSSNVASGSGAGSASASGFASGSAAASGPAVATSTAGANGTTPASATAPAASATNGTTTADGDGDTTMNTSTTKTPATTAGQAGAATAAPSATPAAASTATTAAAAAKGKTVNRSLTAGLMTNEVVSGTAMRQRDDLMEPSRIYGAEHLLRLFVNLPALVAHTTLDSESIQILKDHLNEFMTYMTRERDRIFVKEYQPASVEYHRMSGN